MTEEQHVVIDDLDPPAHVDLYPGRLRSRIVVWAGTMRSVTRLERTTWRWQAQRVFDERVANLRAAAETSHRSE